MYNECSFTVYIMTNKNHTVFYTGMTNDIVRRVTEHKLKLIDGFTKKYNVDKLVYQEHMQYADDAIYREKQIKGWLRSKKIALIENDNPHYDDLYYTELVKKEEEQAIIENVILRHNQSVKDRKDMEEWEMRDKKERENKRKNDPLIQFLQKKKNY